MGQPVSSRATKKARGPASDPGYRLVSVQRLREHIDPFANPPWEEVASISVEAVKNAIALGRFRSEPYSGAKHSTPWTVDDHIERIAFLCVNGWTDPIDIDVGIPSMNCWVDWMVHDGNHRLAAAIVRDDEYILSSIAGCCNHMRKLFGRLRLPASVGMAA